MKLVVGCPIRNRAWILRPWSLFVEAACEAVGVEPIYAFVMAKDDDSAEVIERFEHEVIMVTTDEALVPDGHQWNEARYREMVSVRNQLLAAVRECQPDYFLSLDSDILIHEAVLANLLADLSRFDAAGGKCFMTPQGTDHPSYANFLNAAGLLRPNTSDVIPVDAIMAIKLMSPAAYEIDYAFHIYGEDLGWSRSATRAGLKLGWDGRVVSKHVMLPELLEPVDVRCGY